MADAGERSVPLAYVRRADYVRHLARVKRAADLAFVAWGLAVVALVTLSQSGAVPERAGILAASVAAALGLVAGYLLRRTDLRRRYLRRALPRIGDQDRIRLVAAGVPPAVADAAVSAAEHGPAVWTREQVGDLCVESRVTGSRIADDDTPTLDLRWYVYTA